jgi:DNA primase
MAGRPAPRVQPPQAPPPTGATEDRLRVLAAILLHHPELWDELGAAFESIDLPPWMARVRDRIRTWTETSTTLDPGALLMNLIAAGLQGEVDRIINDLPPLAQPDAPADVAIAEWWQTAKLLTIDRLREDAQRAEADAIQAKTPETMRRLVALRRELQKATAGEAD